MIIIPPDEADEFMANESGTVFTSEQLDFFRQAKKNYMKFMMKGCRGRENPGALALG